MKKKQNFLGGESRDSSAKTVKQKSGGDRNLKGGANRQGHPASGVEGGQRKQSGPRLQVKAEQ